MPTNEELTAIRHRATEQFKQLPGVHFVGIGVKEVDGRLTGQAAVKVFVRRKHTDADLPPEQRIPTTFEGLPTDVVETGELTQIADPPGADEPPAGRWADDARHRPLIGGSQIVRQDSRVGGTLGCLVWDRTDHDRVFGLTCYHVMAGADVPPPNGATEVGQPTPDGSLSKCCGGSVGWHSIGAQVPGPNVELKDRDEAIFRIMPGRDWRPDILGLGPDKAPAAVRGTHQVTELEATTAYKVRKYGARTGLTGGTLASGLMDGPLIADNIIAIRSNPSASTTPGTGTPTFATFGDSGSVVVNDANEVVGLIYYRATGNLILALAINNVLGRLSATGSMQLEVVTADTPGRVFTAVGSAMVDVPPEVAPVLTGTPPSAEPSTEAPTPAPTPGRVRVPVGAGWLPGAPIPSPALMGGLEGDLDRSPTGRLLITMWLRHQHELVHLVNNNKRVAMVWHRSGAAAVLQYVARMLQQPDLALPETVNGAPLDECLDRLHRVLDRFGSTRLREDLDRIKAALPDLGGRTYPQIVDALGQA